MRNKVVLASGYAFEFMHSGYSVYNMVVFSSSVFNRIVEGHGKVLPHPKPLAVRWSLHEGEQGFVICQNYKLVSSQLSFKKV